MDFNALEWGFQEQRGKLHPVPTELPPAPDELLKIIKCGCTISDCASKGRCTCKGFGLSCSVHGMQRVLGRQLMCLNSMLTREEKELGDHA